jgi:hypothetical protein
MTNRPNVHLINYSTLNMTSPFLTSEQSRDYLDVVTVITVEKINGSPATATLSPTFQLWHAVVGGNQDEVNTGGTGVDPANSWLTLSAASNPSLLPDGDWPVNLDVSGAAVATPIILARRILGGFPWRLKLDWAFTGGSSPSMQISAMSYCRERFAGGFDRAQSGT